MSLSIDFPCGCRRRVHYMIYTGSGKGDVCNTQRKPDVAKPYRCELIESRMCRFEWIVVNATPYVWVCRKTLRVVENSFQVYIIFYIVVKPRKLYSINVNFFSIRKNELQWLTTITIQSDMQTDLTNFLRYELL